MEPLKSSGTEARGVSLRTHIILLFALVAAFCSASTGSYWLRSLEQRRLERAFKEDLFLLARLPLLRSGIRRIDLLGELGREEAPARWNGDRARAIADVERTYQELMLSPQSEPTKIALEDFHDQFASFVQDTGGRLGQARPSVAEDLASAKDQREDLLEQVTSIGDRAMAELQTRLDRSGYVSEGLTGLRIIVELLAASAIAAYFFVYILLPIAKIEELARNWRLGDQWPRAAVPAIPEIRDMMEHFGAMAQRLNDQFRKEKELNEFKTRLVALVGHEFGNALSILQNAVFILHEKATPEQTDENGPIYSMMTANINGLGQAVNNLMNMSRLEAGKLAISFSPTSMVEIFKLILERMTLIIERKKLSIHLNVPHGLPPLKADPAALQLVISNLFSNAVKYTFVGGNITLGVHAADDGSFEVFVADTGIGISSADLPRVLSGHYRAETGQKMTQKGFGIGLSLARQVIEAHDSSLIVESEPGRGSRFSFRLRAWGPC